MFADGRSRKWCSGPLPAEPNAISDGTVYPAAFRELVQFFWNIRWNRSSFLPDLCLGLDGNRLGAQSPVTEAHPYSCRHATSRMLEDLVESIMHQVLGTTDTGSHRAFLGANRSPTAGWNHVRPQSRDARPWPFLGALEDRIRAAGLEIPSGREGLRSLNLLRGCPL